MSSSVRVLDFFIVEANEYIDQMDRALGGAAGRPDVDQLLAAARKLRGSATMARQVPIAAVATSFERVARAAHTRTLAWGAGLSAALVAAIDDLRILIRGVRSWSALETERARARQEELDRIVPPTTTPVQTPAAGAAGSGFLASEIAELGRALEHVAGRPDQAALSAVTDRVRAIRGVADVRDLPPLPEVMEAVESTLKAVELAAPAPPAARQLQLMAAAAALLRRVAHDIATRGKPEPGHPEQADFERAWSAVAEDAGHAGDRIVPIAQLFHDDGGPHVVTTAPHPPTTPAQRFRMEVVSLAEHLRAVVADARTHAGAPAHRDRVTRELRSALRALGATANSFGEKQVARFAAEWSVQSASAGARTLDVLDAAAALLADPSTSTVEIVRGLERLGAGRTPVSVSRPDLRAVTPPAGVGTVGAHAPSGGGVRSHTPARARDRVRTPTGPALQAYIDDGLAGFRELEQTPLSRPTPVPGDEVVPIEQLLYRGRSALARAAELRQEMLRQGEAPSRELVQELFDLIELALVE